MAAGEMEVGGFNIERTVEMTMIQALIDVQKSDLGGGDMPNEFDRIVAIEGIKEVGERVGTSRPKDENVINKCWASREQNGGNPVN